MKVNDVYVNLPQAPIQSIIKIIHIDGKIIKFKNLCGFFEGLALYWEREDFEKYYVFNQELTDLYIIKDIIE